MVSYLDLAIANDTIKTTGIERKDKDGNITVNEYAQVNERIKAFRMVYPQGSIRTEMISNENGVCIFKAVVISESGIILGTGTAYEKENSSFINKTSYIENCETSAVGRALGMAGFGIDVSVASAEEIENAIENQKNIEITEEEAKEYVINFGKKHPGEKLADVINEDKQYVLWYIDKHPSDIYFQKCYEILTGQAVPTEEESKERISLQQEIMNLVSDTDTDYDDILGHYEVKSNTEMTLEQLKDCKKNLEKKLERQLLEKAVNEE